VLCYAGWEKDREDTGFGVYRLDLQKKNVPLFSKRIGWSKRRTYNDIFLDDEVRGSKAPFVGDDVADADNIFLCQRYEFHFCSFAKGRNKTK